MEIDVVIADKKGLEEKNRIFFREGREKIHVVADFDRTLTKAYVNGEYIPSTIALLRNKDYITKDYSKKAKELAAKYHPIEKNPDIPPEEKKKKMEEWWTSHFRLLIESGLNRKHLEKIVQSKELQFREGALEFFDILHEAKIPMVIISSTGVGDVIPMLFQREGRLYDNIHFITNLYSWDKDGNATGIKKQIITSMNKDETAIQHFPVFNLIKNRKNVLLLGDSIGDLGMVKGFEYDNIIKIGFLNDETEKHIKDYRKNFDIVMLNDASMNYVAELMGEITSKRDIK